MTKTDRSETAVRFQPA